MEIYIKFILIGLAVAMPVGAITVEMTKQGLRNGFTHGWAVGLGGMTVDAALILAMYFGFASLLSLPYIQIPLWLAGAGVLAYLGYDSIRYSDLPLNGAADKTCKINASFGEPIVTVYLSLSPRVISFLDLCFRYSSIGFLSIHGSAQLYDRGNRHIMRHFTS